MSKLCVQVAPTIKNQSDVPVYGNESLAGRIQDLEFGTSVPGGFLNCGFKIPMSSSEAFYWYSTRIGHHVLITDKGQTVWEGRIDNIELGSFRVTISALGYWVSLTDQILYQRWADTGLSSWKEFSSVEFVGFSNAKPEAFENNNPGSLVTALRNGETYNSGNPSSGYVYVLPTPVFVASFPIAPNTVQYIKFGLVITNADSSDLRVRIFTASNPYSGSWTQKASYKIADNGNKEIAVGGGSEDIKAVAFIVDDDKVHTYAGATGDARVVISDIQTWADIDPMNINRLTAHRFILDNLLGKPSLGLSSTMPQISPDTLYVKDPGLDIMPLLVEGKTVQDAILELSSYGDDQSPPNEYFPAIWDSRRFFFEPKEKLMVRWLIRLKEFSEDGLNLMQSLENYWSKVYVRYTDIKERLAFTTVKEDIVFQSPSIDRTNIVGADVRQLAVANVLRDAFFEDFRKPQQRTEVSITGRIRNRHNVPEPLWMVRAGDLLFVEDLFSFSGGTSLDPLRLFSIRETSYNYENNELTLTPDWPANRLDILVSRLSALGKEF